MRINQSFFSLGVFQQDASELTSQRDRPQDVHREIDITNYGASGAYKVTPKVFIGASLSVYAFRIDTLVRRFGLDGGFTEAPNLNDESARASQTGTELSVVPTLGVLLGQDNLRAGIVYRRGPSFTYTTQDGNAPLRQPTFRVPDTLAFGVSHMAELLTSSQQPRVVNAELTLAAGITRVTYSRLRQDFVVDQALATGREASFSVDDGTEIHVGLQYTRPRWRGHPSFRAGAWSRSAAWRHLPACAGSDELDRSPL